VTLEGLTKTLQSQHHHVDRTIHEGPSIVSRIPAELTTRFDSDLNTIPSPFQHDRVSKADRVKPFRFGDATYARIFVAGFVVGSASA
jgi:hypothetical protein